MSARFVNHDYLPPGGKFWFDDGPVHIETRSRFEMTNAIRTYLRKTGQPVPHDPFDLAMACMCPHLPDGVCDKPSGVKIVRMDEVKDNTRKLFRPCPQAAYDDISARLATCHSCPEHDRNFCPGCTGLPEWISRGFGGDRRPVPADLASGICKRDHVLVSAAATPADPAKLGEGAPNGCWRK